MLSVSTGGPRASCASPEKQAGNDLLEATALCYPSPSPTLTTDPQKPPTSVNSWASSTVLKTTLSSSQKHSINNGKRKRYIDIFLFSNCSSIIYVDKQVEHNKLNRVISPPFFLPPTRPDPCARQHMEVHSMCCGLGTNYLHAHCMCHQGAFLVQTLPQLPSSAARPRGG